VRFDRYGRMLLKKPPRKHVRGFVKQLFVPEQSNHAALCRSSGEAEKTKTKAPARSV